MSHTPIYDKLQDVQPNERTADLMAVSQPTVRLVVPQPEAGTVNQLSNRGGLGGRHRRSA